MKDRTHFAICLGHGGRSARPATGAVGVQQRFRRRGPQGSFALKCNPSQTRSASIFSSSARSALLDVEDSERARFDMRTPFGELVPRPFPAQLLTCLAHRARPCGLASRPQWTTIRSCLAGEGADDRPPVSPSTFDVVFPTSAQAAGCELRRLRAGADD